MNNLPLFIYSRNYIKIFIITPNENDITLLISDNINGFILLYSKYFLNNKYSVITADISRIATPYIIYKNIIKQY